MTRRPIAVALPSTPEGVALLVALTSLPPPAILLHPDVRAWRSEPAIPVGTPLILPPALAHLAPDGEKVGLVPFVLPDASTRAAGPPVDAFSGGGIVQFTSGSTGPPKPVFFPMPTCLAGARSRVRSMGLEPGAGIAMSASPVYGQGLRYLATAVLLGGPLALLDPHDHRQALVTLAEPALACWRATRHLVEALTHCVLTGPAVVPRLCVVGTPLPPALHDAFVARFGVPLRQGYSSTETGPICLDVGPPERVERDTVGRPSTASRSASATIRPSRSSPSGWGGSGRAVRARWRATDSRRTSSAPATWTGGGPLRTWDGFAPTGISSSPAGWTTRSGPGTTAP